MTDLEKAAEELQATIEAEAKTKAPKRGRKKAKAPSAVQLRAAIAQIEEMNHAGGRGLLIEEMVAAGATIGQADDRALVEHLGVSADLSGSLGDALTVWAERARVAAMQAEDV